MMKRKRFARALRARLLRGVVFSDAAVDRMVKASAWLAAAVRFMGSGEDEGEEDEERFAVVEWSFSGHSGPGVYVHSLEYPEEGTLFVPILLGDAMRMAGGG